MDRIINFIQTYLPYDDREVIKKYIEKHQEYGTFDYALDTSGSIVSTVRWNVDGECWDILDFIIREDFRHRGIGRDMILRGLKRFPDGKYLRFKRGVRCDKNTKVLSIDKIIGKRIF